PAPGVTPPPLVGLRGGGPGRAPGAPLRARESPLGIWLCGGAGVAGELIDEVDELVIKTYPQLYGSGMPMFGGVAFAVTDFALRDTRTFGNGVVVRRYGRNR
ncbi:dihydrofolate reductase family protein, partial [Streptomyces sp. Act-28]